MPELRLIIFIFGGLAVAAIVMHGLLSKRKGKQNKFSDTPSDDANPIDNGNSNLLNEQEPEIGEINDPLFGRSDNSLSQQQSFSALNSDDELASPEFSALDNNLADIPMDTVPDPLFEQPIVNQQAVSQEQAYVQTVPQQQHQQQTQPVHQHEQPVQHHHQQSVSSEQVPEPVPQNAPVQPNVAQQEPAKAKPVKVAEEEEELTDGINAIILHVHTSDKNNLPGRQLFNSLESNGLHFGEMDIFHYYKDGADSGKAIFGVANMLEPGTFDYHHPNDFSTKGVTFFMTLPSAGDCDRNFTTMLGAAQRMADELGASVLDNKRNMLTPDRIARYRRQARNAQPKA